MRLETEQLGWKKDIWYGNIWCYFYGLMDGLMECMEEMKK